MNPLPDDGQPPIPPQVKAFLDGLINDVVVSLIKDQRDFEQNQTPSIPRYRRRLGSLISKALYIREYMELTPKALELLKKGMNDETTFIRWGDPEQRLRFKEAISVNNAAQCGISREELKDYLRTALEFEETHPEIRRHMVHEALIGQQLPSQKQRY